MSKINHNLSLETKRKMRVRSKLTTSSEKPRLTVCRTNKYFYMQVVDDTKGVTLVSSSDAKIRKGLKKNETLTKTQSAVKAAEVLAELMKKAKITSVVFDRGQYKYHGRVKAVADAIRGAGIKV